MGVVLSVGMDYRLIHTKSTKHKRIIPPKRKKIVILQNEKRHQDL